MVPIPRHDRALRHDLINHTAGAIIHCCIYASLTHLGWDKMAATLPTTFSNRFSWMKMYECWLKFHWCMFLRVQLTIFQDLFRSPNQWWLDHWCIHASPGLNELNCEIVKWRTAYRIRSYTTISNCIRFHNSPRNNISQIHKWTYFHGSDM